MATIETDEDINKVASAIKGSGGDFSEEGESDAELSTPTPSASHKPLKLMSDQALNAGDRGFASRPEPADSAGPWSDYAAPTTPTPAPTAAPLQKGPWEDFKKPEPDLTKAQTYFDSRFKDWFPPSKLPPQAMSLSNFMGPVPAGPVPPAEHWDPDMHGATPSAPPVTSLMDAFERGFGKTYAGMTSSGKLPDKEVPDNSEWYYQAAAGAGELYGDSPYMIAGALPGVLMANPVIAAAGMALPALLRSSYADNLKNGAVESFDDFWPRAAHVMNETLTSAGINIVTEATGGAINGAMAPSLIRTASHAAGTLAAMVGTGAAFTQTVPSAKSIEGSAAMVLPFALLHHTGVRNEDAHAQMKDKLTDIWEKTGLNPVQVAQHAIENPTVMQDLVSKDIAIPRAYQTAIDPELKGPPGRPVPEEIQKPFGMFNDKDFPNKDYPNEIVPKPGQMDPDSLLKHIGERVKKGKPGMTGSEFERLMTDDISPLNPKNLAPGIKVDAGDNPHTLAQLGWNSAARTMEAVKGAGIRDYNDSSKITHGPFMDAIEPHKDDLSGLREYLVAAHADELHREGFRTVVNPEEAKAVLEAGRGKYDEAARHIGSWNNALLDEYRKSGRVSSQSYDASVGKYNYYYPTKYLTEEGGAIPYSSNRKVFSAMKGVAEDSTSQFVDPFRASVDRGNEVFRQISQEKTKQALINLNSLVGENAFITKKPTPPGMVPISPEILQELKDTHGLHPDVENLTVKNNAKLVLQQNQFIKMVDGKPDVYEANPGHENIIEALKALDPSYLDPAFIKNVKPLLKPLEKIAAFTREAYTVSPLFALSHFERQQLLAGPLSRNEISPFLDSMHVMGELFGKESPRYHEFASSGAMMSSFQDLEKNLNKDVFATDQKTGRLDKARNIIKTAYDAYKIPLHVADNSVRFAEFSKAREAGKDIEQAAEDALYVTGNSRQAGAAMRMLNVYTPFQGLEINSQKKLYDAFAANPGAMAAKFFTRLTLPALGIWFANRDDKRFTDLLHSDNSSIPIPIGDTVYKLPVPWGPGIASMIMPMRFVDQFYQHDKEAFGSFDGFMKNLGAGTKGSLGLMAHSAPIDLNAGVKMLAENMSNYDFHTGQPIVSHKYDNVVTHDQASEYTSHVAQGLSNMMTAVSPLARDTTHTSPIMVQHMMDMLTGTPGQQITRAIDTGVEKLGLTPAKPELAWNPWDYPFARSQIEQYPSTNSAAIKEFYDNAHSVRVDLATISERKKSGDIEGAMKLQNEMIQKGDPNPVQMVKAMGEFHTRIHNIGLTTSYTPEDRRQLISKQAEMMNDLAKKFNENFNKVGNKTSTQNARDIWSEK